MRKMSGTSTITAPSGAISTETLACAQLPKRTEAGRLNYSQAHPIPARKEGSAVTRGPNDTGQRRFSKSIRAAVAAGYAKFAGVCSLIAAEAYGVWTSIWGPLSVQTWGPATDETISQGQTVAVDGGSCNVSFINQFGNQFNFEILGNNGNGGTQSFYNIGMGGHIIEFGRPSGLCNDPIKITLLSKAANGAVNVAIQTSQSWGEQQIVGCVSIFALLMTAAISITYVISEKK